MKLIEALVPESINPNLRSRAKDDLFGEMVALLKRNPTLAGVDDSTIRKALDEREKTGTTGVGKEVGIPHGKIMGLSTICAAIGVAKRGIEYGSVDGLPVRFVVAVVAPPEQSQAYLRILAKIARLLSDPSFTEMLVTAKGPDEIYRAIESIEGGARVEAMKEPMLLIFELTDTDYLDAVVEYFTEVGATSATVLDGRNVQGFITRVPLFADFAKVFTEGQASGTIFMLLIDKGAVPRFIEELEEIIGDLEEEGRGIVFTIDVASVKGGLSRLEL
jgi:mannitol/fructose-specific phosphotransferase system IIA component (Ntr-type)